MRGGWTLAAAGGPEGPQWSEILNALIIWLALGMIGLLLAGVLRLSRSGRGRLFPPQRQRAVPWNFMHLLLVAIAYLGWQQLMQMLLGVEKTLDDPERTSRQILAVLFAFPLQVLTVVAVLWRGADMQLYQIGATCHRWRQNLQAAWVFWLAATPAAFAVHFATRHLIVQMGQPLAENRFELWVESGPGGWQAAAFVAAVLLAAPIVEELIFRGVVQPWFITTPRAADLTMLAAIITFLILGVRLDSWWPLLFLFIVSPCYLAFEAATWRWLPRPDAARGIYATSLLFAALHFGDWPAPVPLFVLSLGLGMLAYRTQSLLGPVAMHAAFNAVSTVDVIRRMAGW